jgi:hypothetical protein
MENFPCSNHLYLENIPYMTPVKHYFMENISMLFSMLYFTFLFPQKGLIWKIIFHSNHRKIKCYCLCNLDSAKKGTEKDKGKNLLHFEEI